MTNFTDFKDIHTALGIKTSDLGCVMLDFESLGDADIPDEWLYYAETPEHFWIKGYVGNSPHVTLLYGLLEQGETWREHIVELLNDWVPENGEPMGIIRFQSPYPEEQYVCLAAELHITESLMDAHRRLSYLPHIDTFTPYRPHVTLAYVRTEHADMCEELLNALILGRKFRPTYINLGSDKS